MSIPFRQRLKDGVGHIFGLGYDGGETSRYRRDLGWGRMVPRDEDSMVSGDKTREWLRLKGADLARNNAVVAGLCDRLDAFFVGSGVRPQAKTSSREWNRQAEQFWQTWSLSCDIRQQATFADLQGIAVNSRPTSGGLYFELLDNGRIRPIECERIRQPTDPGMAKGYVDGVKRNPSTGIILGYWVHDRDADGTFSAKHGERFIPRENIVPVIRRPRRPDQCREIPDLAPVIPILTDMHEMNTYVLNTAKTRSQIIGFIKRLNGQAANMQPRNAASAPTNNQRESWRMDWGQMYNLFTQEDVVFPTLNMPDAGTIPFMKLELMLAASAMNLPYEFFVYDFSALDFSRQKGVILFVNQVRRVWLSWLNQNMNQRIWNWRIAKAIKAGILPPAPTDDRKVSEWFKVEWHADEEIAIDRQERNQSDILEWQMGLTTLTAAAKRRGIDLEDALNEKADILLMASRIEQEKGLPPGSLINAQIPGQADPKAVGQEEPPAEKAEEPPKEEAKQ